MINKYCNCETKHHAHHWKEDTDKITCVHCDKEIKLDIPKEKFWLADLWYWVSFIPRMMIIFPIVAWVFFMDGQEDIYGG